MNKFSEYANQKGITLLNWYAGLAMQALIIQDKDNVLSSKDIALDARIQASRMVVLAKEDEDEQNRDSSKDLLHNKA